MATTIQDNVNNYYFKNQADFEAHKAEIPNNSTIYIEETGEVNVEINGTETENVEDLINIIVGDKTYKVTGGGTSINTNGLNVTQEVLWTNPNPTSKFVGQSINTSSSMTDFDYIMMTYYDVYDILFLQSTIVPPGINFALEQVHGNKNMTFYASRYITYIDSTTLAIDYAYDQQSKTDANCVPVQLIGFKFLDTLNYSTEEQYTGKHWIDGKKIYEKTFEYTSGWVVGGDATLTYSIPNINNITSFNSIMYRNNGMTITDQQVVNIDDRDWSIQIYNVKTNELRIYIGSHYTGTEAINKIILTFEYTKTTE